MPKFKEPETGNKLYYSWDTAYNILQTNNLKKDLYQK